MQIKSSSLVYDYEIATIFCLENVSLNGKTENRFDCY